MKKLLIFMLLAMMGGNLLAATAPPRVKGLSFFPLVREEAGLIELYRNLDPKILGSDDSLAVEQYLLPFNQKVVAYVKEHYDTDLSAQFKLDDPTILISGLFIADLETREGPYTKEAPLDLGQLMSCVAAAIGLGKGIKDLIKGYTALFEGGASMSTLLGVIKNFAIRYVGWFMVAYAVYHFGDCMNWW
jgi:hypothetical protein